MLKFHQHSHDSVEFYFSDFAQNLDLVLGNVSSNMFGQAAPNKVGSSVNVLSELCEGQGDDLRFLAESGRLDWLGKPENVIDVMADPRIAAKRCTANAISCSDFRLEGKARTWRLHASLYEPANIISDTRYTSFSGRKTPGKSDRSGKVSDASSTASAVWKRTVIERVLS